MTTTNGIPTKSGAELRLIDHTDLSWINSELGEGTMLSIKMQDPSDTRFAEVFLDPEAKQKLAKALLSPDLRAAIEEVLGSVKPTDDPMKTLAAVRHLREVWA